MQLVYGFLLAVAIAFLAHRAHSLNRSGALAATVTGTIIFGLGGWQWAILLLTFFVTSSALSRAFKKQKTKLEEKYSKGHERDAGQVFGNGGVASLFALLHGFFPAALWPWLGFAAALAAVNADTWATEIGAFSTRPPRLVTTGATVAPGTSGGITLLGTLGGAVGAAMMGVLAGVLEPGSGATEPTLSGAALALGVALAGAVGMLADSLLGAAAQGQFECASCGRRFERAAAVCHEPVRRIGGLAWLDNDGVNLATTLVGALAALAWRCWA